MKSLTLLLVGTLLLTGTSVLLQAQTDPPPSSPIINPHLPAMLQWQMHFTYTEDAAPPPPQGTVDPNSPAVLPPRDVIVTITKPIWHAVLIDKAGKKSETWFDGTTSYLILPDDPNPDPVAADATDILPTYIGYAKDGRNGPQFPDLNWLSAKNYTGTETINETKCYVFHSADGNMAAWVDMQTRLPVRWQRGNETRDFTFTRPSSRLVLPAKVATIAKMIKIVQENNNRQPVRGQ